LHNPALWSTALNAVRSSRSASSCLLAGARFLAATAIGFGVSLLFESPS